MIEKVYGYLPYQSIIAAKLSTSFFVSTRLLEKDCHLPFGNHILPITMAQGYFAI